MDEETNFFLKGYENTTLSNYQLKGLVQTDTEVREKITQNKHSTIEEYASFCIY